MSVATLSGYAPQRRFDDKPWVGARIEGAAVDAGPWIEVESFTFALPDFDPTTPAVRSFTTEQVDATTTSFLRIVFTDAASNEEITDPLPLGTVGVLATVPSIGVRIGRDLSDVEVAQVGQLISQATINIIASLGRNPFTWMVPAAAKPFLSALCVELASRAMANPQALGQESETIGAYSRTVTYAREIPGSGIGLTPAEELTVRRVVFGSNVGSVQVSNLSDEFAENVWFPVIYYGLMADTDEPTDVFFIWR